METQEKQIKIKQPPVLFAKTQAVIAQLAESGRPADHLLEQPARLGLPFGRGGAVRRARPLGRQDTIYLFLKSDGGSGQVSLRLVNLLRQHCRHLVALVPLECASAATMIALGAPTDPDGPDGLPHGGGHLAEPRPVAG
jgi:hypothetical protein